MKFFHIVKQIDGDESVFTRISFHTETPVPSGLADNKEKYISRTKKIHEYQINRSMSHHAIDSMETKGTFIYMPDGPSSKIPFALRVSPEVPDGTIVVNPNFLGQVNEHFIANVVDTTLVAIDNEVLKNIYLSGHASTFCLFQGL